MMQTSTAINHPSKKDSIGLSRARDTFYIKDLRMDPRMLVMLVVSGIAIAQTISISSDLCRYHDTKSFAASDTHSSPLQSLQHQYCFLWRELTVLPGQSISSLHWILNFFSLSYPVENGNETQYSKGPRDTYFIIGCILVLSVLEIIMNSFLEQVFLVIRDKSFKDESTGNSEFMDIRIIVVAHVFLDFELRKSRFVEQSFLGLWYIASLSYGLVMG
jgi:hypothetical protein